MRTINFANDPDNFFRTNNHILNMTKGIRDHKQKMEKLSSDSPIYSCDDREPESTKSAAGAFLPVFAGEINAEFPT